MKKAVEVRERKNVSINMLTVKIISNHINSFHFSRARLGSALFLEGLDLLFLLDQSQKKLK